MPRCAVGIDFGTLSARAVIAEVESGREIACGQCEYPHGVMENALPAGERLGPGFALQHPGDYLYALERSVRDALAQAPEAARDVIALGLDVTASTLLPLDAEGRPLCLRDEFAREPFAYALLWMHAAPQRYADRMTEAAQARGEPWLPYLGDRIDAQWTHPKLWQLMDEAPRVFAAAARFAEAGDWLTEQLCGRALRSASMAGYKALRAEGGGPGQGYFAALDPRLEELTRQKLTGPVLPIASMAGRLLPAMAKRLGLPAGIPVAVGLIDAHASVAGCGVTESGHMVYIAGTSGCHLMLGDRALPVPGICGVVKDGMMPGLFGYEAGQNCVGEAFGWVARHLTPESYHREAARQGIDIQSHLTALAGRLAPGESGLLALDFWRGNRSILADSDLSGLILGLTPRTRAEHIYRALLEASAFGTRTIIDNYRENGLPVRRLTVTGGISHKNALLMQILSDTLGMPVCVPGTRNSGALGSAVLAAAAAGSGGGGYGSAAEAARHMGSPPEREYHPGREAGAVYGRLYREYARLHDAFGRGEWDVMKRLSALAREAAGHKEGETGERD